MYYRSGTDGCCSVGANASFHSPCGSTCWKCDVKSKMTLLICVNILESHSCQITSRSDLNRWSLRLFWRGRPNKKNNKNKMSNDMRSVPDLQYMANWCTASKNTQNWNNIETMTRIMKHSHEHWLQSYEHCTLYNKRDPSQSHTT